MDQATITQIIMALITTSGLTGWAKHLIEDALVSIKLPLWVKQYALPILAAAAITLSTGSTDALDALPASGITLPVVVGLIASGIYRLLKGAPSTP